ncbi:alpha/beta fold hydrolase [Cryptosporangium arvum]|uniref:alpha/beta fold hydrolase n=1 Tax=Cryptosporangium arvum TaxID=80871 RepID=UPI0004B0E483|nr:alpha/beta hydrolase [Cryptosporangium arvum]
MLDVPGARLHYELRGRGPLVVLAGAPMDADAFTGVADLLALDHTVLTTDPRGINRSTVDDPDRDSTPEDRADDLARLIAHADAGPAVAFGSSGGAVSVLALAQRHPGSVRAVIAHEPPLIDLLDDRAQRRAKTEEMIATYLAGDHRGAWVKFLANANIHLPGEVFEMMFGGPREGRAAEDEYYGFVRMLRGTSYWRPDLEVLRTATVEVGIGEESAGQLCDRTSRALATALGTTPTLFPGDHTGFLDHPKEFAALISARG